MIIDALLISMCLAASGAIDMQTANTASDSGSKSLVKYEDAVQISFFVDLLSNHVFK